MKIKIINILLVVTMMFFTSCNKDSEKIEQKLTKDTNSNSQDLVSPKLKKLNGVWVSEDDSKDKMEIKLNHEAKQINSIVNYYDNKIISEGMFLLGDSCLENKNGKENLNGEYLSVFETDDNYCYYIVSLSETNLELSYVGRGNTLSYRREN